MATGWDRRGAKQATELRNALVATQFRDGVGPFSPFWRAQLSALGIRSSTLTSVKDLAKLPAVGERDLCPDGDPAGAAKMVLQADEEGWGLHVSGPSLRRGLARRLVQPASYRRQVEADIRPVSYHLGGLGLRFPVASTRSDLDLIARAGARLWSVLGLTPADVLVSALPEDPELVGMALPAAALGAGAPAFHVGARAAEVLGYVAATVLAVPDIETLAELAELGLASVKTVLIPGPVEPGAEREVAQLLPTARLLSVWGPADGRVLYAWCQTGGRAGGWHTYPDLEVLETLDLASGERAGRGLLDAPGELAVTQLGFRGSALVRWRTGAVLPAAPMTDPCRFCGRTVPRLPSELDPYGAVPMLLAGRGTSVPVDLRAVAAALAGRADLRGWQVDAGGGASAPGGVSFRPESRQLVVVINPNGDPNTVATGVARDIRAAAGVVPAQVLVDRSLTGGGIVGS